MSNVREYRFGRWRLVTAERRLLEGDAPRKVGSRAYDTLLALLERRDRVVPKAELLERVWPGMVVEENNLQVQVASLRKLLGADAIATIPAQGYRFTLAAEAVPAAPPSAMGPSSAEVPRPAAPVSGIPDARPAPGAPAPTPARGAPASTAAPAPPAAPRRHNLPERLAPLYGRDDDLAAVGALLERETLVSIVGAGGIGKTRVAEAVAHLRRDAYPDGTWVVELAALTDSRLVVAEVARVLHLPQATADVPGIVAALALQSLLLVLDNCEHLQDAVAGLADALARGAGGVRMLVTSQEPLKIAAEHVYRLDPLPVPADDDRDGERYGAVQLFARRAEAADPRFALGEATLPAVLEICRRLDGIPLALELAAARVPLLGVEGVRARLHERFHVLSGGSRLVLRRHQTLRAALDFSHGLLSADERAVFRRVGVFTGTFGVEQAQAVCTDASLDAWQVLECLGALVDKSLLMSQGRASRRLRLLESTRAYALEKLAEVDETDALLERHARMVAGLFRPAYDSYWRLPQQEWLARFEPELDNLRAALGWALAEDPALAIELMGDSLKLWQELALQPEAVRHCEAALALVTDRTPARAAGRLWYALAMMSANVWNARSREAARQAVTLLREANDEEVLALALTRLAGAMRTQPEQEQWDALAELERLANPRWQGQLRWCTHYARAVLTRATRRFREAHDHYARASATAAECGQPTFVLRTRTNMAEMLAASGDLDGAITVLRDIVASFASTGDRLFHLFALMDLAQALLRKGQHEEAREPFVAGVPLVLRYDLAYRYAETAALFAARFGDVRVAAQLLGYARASNAARGEKDLDPSEVPAGEAARECLRGVPREQVEAWMQEGAGMRDADLLAAAVASAGAR